MAHFSHSSKQPFKNAEERLNEMSTVHYVSTGSVELDKMIGGGVESGSITHFYGTGGTGKTQLIDTLSVTAQLPSNLGGISAEVLIIDVDNRVRKSRLNQIATTRCVSPDKIWQGIKIWTPSNSEEQLNCLKDVTAAAGDSKSLILIVDGLMSHYQTEFGLMTIPRQEHLQEFLSEVQKLMRQNPTMPVVYTSRVRDNMKPNRLPTDPKHEPIGGPTLLHHCKTSVYLTRIGGDDSTMSRRYAMLENSPFMPPATCEFKISEKGIEDSA